MRAFRTTVSMLARARFLSACTRSWYTDVCVCGVCTHFDTYKEMRSALKASSTSSLLLSSLRQPHYLAQLSRRLAQRAERVAPH